MKKTDKRNGKKPSFYQTMKDVLLFTTGFAAGSTVSFGAVMGMKRALGKFQELLEQDALAKGIDDKLFEELWNLPEAPDNGRATLELLWQDPASHSALRVLPFLACANRPSEYKDMLKSMVGGRIEYKRGKASGNGIGEPFLTDMAIEDPQCPGNKIFFEMVDRRYNKKKSLKAVAFYQPQSKTVIFAFAGFDKTKEDILNVSRTMDGYPNPATKAVDGFLEQILQELKSEGKEVQHSVILGYSFGTGPALATLERCTKQPPPGGIPKTLLLEGWKEQQEAKFVAQDSNPDKDATHHIEEVLAPHIISARHIPGTIIVQKGNEIIGSRAIAIVSRDGGHYGPLERLFNRHFVKEVIGRLFDEKVSRAVEVPPEILSRAEASRLGQRFHGLAVLLSQSFPLDSLHKHGSTPEKNR